jgi:hypothetical protein
VYVTVGIALLVLVAFALYWLVPRAWHGLWAFFGGFRMLWQRRVADPVFQTFIHILILVRGQVLGALALMALMYWLITRSFRAVSRFTLRVALHQRLKFQENIIGQMESDQGKLKKLFADDIEKIALFGGGEKAEARSGNPALAGYLGWLPSFLWFLIATPILSLISIAFYDGLIRLFTGSEPDTSLLSSAGSHADELSAILPIGKTVSLGYLPTIVLGDRSLLLTAILFVMGLLVWFALGISISGRTLPRLTKVSPLIPFCFSTILSYFFLKSAILIFAITALTCSLVFGLLSKFFLTPLYLRAQAIMPHGNRLEDEGSESDRQSVT